MIDGGIIANNPAMYAYIHSKYANKQDKIRFVSIGTGTTQPTALDSSSVTKVDWLMQVGSLLTVVEQNSHEYLMKMLPD